MRDPKLVATLKIRTILMQHIRDQIALGIAWTLILLSAAFALGTFLGRFFFLD